MLDKARAHHRKKLPRTRQEELPLLDTKKAGAFVRSIKDYLPKLRDRFGPFLHKTRERIDDAYSAAAQILAEQKEAFEDRLAGEKSRSKTARPESKRRPAPARRTRKGTPS